MKHRDTGEGEGEQNEFEWWTERIMSSLGAGCGGEQRRGTAKIKRRHLT
jgi:hypothetical protein